MKKIIIIMILSVLFTACSESIKKPKESDFERIVVLGQSAIQLLLELGLDEKIVGVAYFDNTSDSISKADLPVLSTNWTDKESILALKPDLIFSMEAAFRTDRIGGEDFWNKRGVKTFIIDNYKIEKCFDHYCADIHRTGQLFNIQLKTDTILKRLTDVKNKYIKQNYNSLRVLHLSFIGNSQMYYYPPSMCLLDEIVADCGEKYIDLGDRSFILSIEGIIEANPDKIIVTQFRKQTNDNIIRKLSEHPILKRLPAIENKQIIEVDYTQAIRGTTDMQNIYSEIHNFLKQ